MPKNEMWAALCASLLHLGDRLRVLHTIQLETERILSYERVPRDHVASELYQSHYPLLATIARRRYGLSQEEAENAIHDVFVSFLCTATVIQNPVGWLVGAICNACREQWRHRTRTYQLSRADSTITNLEESILSRQVLERLPLSSQRVLTLHYIEGLTAAEIAARLHTTRRYAERLIHRGLERARREAGKNNAAL